MLLAALEDTMSPSSEFSASSEQDENEETGESEYSDRPTSPRGAPVGTDNEQRQGTPVGW